MQLYFDMEKSGENRRVMKRKYASMSCVHRHAHTLLVHPGQNSENHTEIGMDGYAFFERGVGSFEFI